MNNSTILPPHNLFPQYFESSNKSGLWIFHRDWVIPNFLRLELNLAAPKGVVIVCHGLAEHIQRYEPLAQALNQAGFACYGLDFEGHGLSDGDRSYVERFEHYINDVLYFAEGVKNEYKEYKIPIFLFGHSMGGLIAAFAAKQTQKMDVFNGGVILSAPFMGIAPASDITSFPFIKSLLRFLSQKLPKLQCIALDNKGLSHDPTILYALQRDRLHHTDMICCRTIQELIDAANLMLETATNVTYPYLLFGGSADPLCDANKWKIFHDRTLSDDKEFVIFESLYHECLNETQPEQKKVIEKIIQWLLQRCEIYDLVL